MESLAEGHTMESFVGGRTMDLLSPLSPMSSLLDLQKQYSRIHRTHQTEKNSIF